MGTYEGNLLIGLGIFLLLSALVLGFIQAFKKSKEELPEEILENIKNNHITRKQKILAFSVFYSICYILGIIFISLFLVLFIYLAVEYKFNEKILLLVYLGFLGLLVKIGLVKAVLTVGNFIVIKILSIFKEDSEY